MVTPNVGAATPPPRRPRPHALPLSATVSPAVAMLYGAACRITGWSLVETTGTARAEIRIIDGRDTTGQVLADITLSAGESTRDYWGPDGIPARVGVLADIVSGSVSGAVYVVSE